MKYFILSAFLLLVCSCATNKQPESVYICTGLKGDSFHTKPNCKGLSDCDGELGVVTVADAMEIGLHPCKICFPKDSIQKFEKNHPGVIN